MVILYCLHYPIVTNNQNAHPHFRQQSHSLLLLRKVLHLKHRRLLLQLDELHSHLIPPTRTASSIDL